MVGGRALAALLGAASVGAVVMAQSGSVAAQSAQTAFDVPAGPLNRALTAYGRQAGLQVTYLTAIAAGKSSSGFSGTATSGEALGRILAGSGLRYAFTNATTVAISTTAATEESGAATEEGAVVLEPISVEGANPNALLGAPPAPYAGGQVATGGQLGMLGNRSVMNAPFSQTTYTNKTIQDRQARTVNEVLSNDPSVIVTAIGVRNDAEYIRGFQNIATTGTRSLNGLAGVAPIEFPSADVIDRVEVLKGPSALLNGAAASGSGAIGGTINLTTKRATDDPIAELTARYSSDSQFGTHLDIGRRFGPDNAFGIRVNGSFDSGHTSVDRQWGRNRAFSLGVDYTGDRFRVAADLLHQKQEDSPRANYVSFRAGAYASATGIPSAPNASKSLFPNWDEGRSEGTIGMARAEFDILENVTAYGAIGAQSADKRFFVAGPAALQNTSGQMTLQPYLQENRYDVFSFQGGVRASVTTGFIDHALNVNYSRAKYEDDSSFRTGAVSNGGTIYDPVFPAPILTSIESLRNNKSTVSSIGFADTLSLFDERVQFTAGVRYQKIETDALNLNNNVLTAYEADAWSPAFGIVVKPWENVSVYANYMEGLQAGQTVAQGLANAGAVLPPFVSEQYEAGVKVDFGTLTTTLAVFQITQPNLLTVNNTQTADGEQRNRGVELSVFGEIVEGVRLLGGVTFLDAEQTKASNSLFDGERAIGTPKTRLVVGGEWDTPFAQGLTLTGRFTYTSNQTVRNNRPDLKLPSWTQVDVGARYLLDTPWLDKPVTVRFNVDNLLDKNYWVGAFSDGFVHLSQPRTYRLSTTFTF